MHIASVIKDYQTLLASIIALAAAIIAYSFAQRVAKSARDASIELAEMTRVQTLRDQADQERRFRLAILLELRSDLDAFRRVHAFRVRFAEMLSGGSVHAEDSQVSFTKFQLAFASLKLTIGRLDNLLIAKIEASDMSVLDMQTQRNIHFFAFSMHLAETMLSDLSIDLTSRNNNIILGIEINNFRNTVKAASEAEEHVRSFLDKKLDEIGKEPHTRQVVGLSAGS